MQQLPQSVNLIDATMQGSLAEVLHLEEPVEAMDAEAADMEEADQPKTLSQLFSGFARMVKQRLVFEDPKWDQAPGLGIALAGVTSAVIIAGKAFTPIAQITPAQGLDPEQGVAGLFFSAVIVGVGLVTAIVPESIGLRKKTPQPQTPKVA